MDEKKENKDTVITVKDLYKIYRIGDNRVRALNGVSFSINKGEFCAIVGASGSGKSTLLYALSGMDRATGGSITYDGKDIVKLSEILSFGRTEFAIGIKSLHIYSLRKPACVCLSFSIFV